MNIKPNGKSRITWLVPMKSTVHRLLAVYVCLTFGGGNLCWAAEPADVIRAGSVWTDDAGHSLIILERNNTTYRARFTKNNQFIREVTGPITGDKISWLAKDVNPIKGGPGGDNFGTIKGNQIDFKFTGNDGKIARVGYSLTRVSEATKHDTSVAGASSARPPTFKIYPNQPLLEAFSLIAPNTSAWVLAPLDEAVPQNIRQSLTYLREDLRDEFKQKPKASASAYEIAERLCSAMIGVLDERDQTLARAGYRAAQADANIKISDDQALSARRNYMMRWPQYRREQDQRNELKSEATAHAQQMKEGPKIEWSGRTVALRAALDNLYAQFREAVRESSPAK